MWPYLSEITAFYESYMIQNNKSIHQLLLLKGRRIFIGTRPGLCEVLIIGMTVRCNFFHNQIQAFLSTSFYLLPQSVQTLPPHLQMKMFTDYHQCLLDDGNEERHDATFPAITFWAWSDTDREVMYTQTLDKKVTVREEVERSHSVKYILNFYFSFSRKSMSEA